MSIPMYVVIPESSKWSCDPVLTKISTVSRSLSILPPPPPNGYLPEGLEKTRAFLKKLNSLGFIRVFEGFLGIF